MDSFFGIGLPELIVILLLAGIIMGPQRIRKVAYTLGRVTAQLQAVSRQFARQLNAELDSLEDKSVKDAVRDVRDLQREVESLRRELRQMPKAMFGEGQNVVKEAEAAMKPAPTSDKSKAAPQSSPPESPEAEKPPLPKVVDVPGDPD